MKHQISFSSKQSAESSFAAALFRRNRKQQFQLFARFGCGCQIHAKGMRNAHSLYQQPAQSCIHSTLHGAVDSQMTPVMNVGLGLVSFVQPCDMMNGARS